MKRIIISSDGNVRSYRGADKPNKHYRPSRSSLERLTTLAYRPNYSVGLQFNLDGLPVVYIRPKLIQ